MILYIYNYSLYIYIYIIHTHISGIFSKPTVNGHIFFVFAGPLQLQGSILSGSADRTVKQWHPVDEAVPGIPR